MFGLQVKLLAGCTFEWLYVLSTTDLFTVAFNCAIIDLGNSILKPLNAIKFPSLPVSILYANLFLFWLQLCSNSVNFTNFMLLKVKDFILIESKLLLLSSQSGTGTSPSLWVSCICLGCWNAELVCTWLLKLHHTILKWFCLPHMLHLLPIARHFLCMCVAPQYGQFSTLCSFSALWVTVCNPSSFAYSFVYGQSFMRPNTFASTLWAHISTCSLSISCVLFWDVSSFMISCVISSLSILFMNCSLGLPSCSL